METKSLVIVSVIAASSLAYASPVGTWEEFHAEVRKADGGQQAAIPPEFARSTNGHVRPYAAIVQNSKWPQTSIPVCWENPSSEDDEGMLWTREAIEQTWESVSGLRFTGWGKCAAINHGIRIRIRDVGPHVKTLGRLLDGRLDGMVLNFTFLNWSPACQQTREHCIKAIAVHEFGHGVGLTHEQNRPDIPGECRGLEQGIDPDVLLTPYDPKSVMNYCNKAWNNDGMLSQLDIEAARLLYGADSSR